jgi:L-alanine-DL-glutamate epimerase-like enolase superfamily enzyme
MALMKAGSSGGAMNSSRIVRVEWAPLHGRRPRPAGSNARLGEHGIGVRVPILRITAADGSSGFGVCHASREQAAALLGVDFEAAFSVDHGVADAWLRFDYPLWDLAGQRAVQPVYAIAAATAGAAARRPYRVPCYDTSLYFDDLHLAAEQAAAELIAAEAREGYDRGHRAFKIKVGRGARHMPLEQGTRRDIAIVHAVRAAVGPGLPIMLDANNGYNLNLAKHVLAETAGCGVFWLEEAFHEDPVLYRDLRGWLADHKLPVLIADGEGRADPGLLDWARDGLVDVIQYDIFGHGFTRWLDTGRQLDALGCRSAPHHYGGHYGNYAAAHLAGAIRGFSYVEWDEAETPGLDTSAYTVDQGSVVVPDAPGFGLKLDQALFAETVAREGFAITM